MPCREMLLKECVKWITRVGVHSRRRRRR